MGLVSVYSLYGIRFGFLGKKLNKLFNQKMYSNYEGKIPYPTIFDHLPDGATKPRSAEGGPSLYEKS